MTFRQPGNIVDQPLHGTAWHASTRGAAKVRAHHGKTASFRTARQRHPLLSGASDAAARRGHGGAAPPPAVGSIHDRVIDETTAVATRTTISPIRRVRLPRMFLRRPVDGCASDRGDRRRRHLPSMEVGSVEAASVEVSPVEEPSMGAPSTRRQRWRSHRRRGHRWRRRRWKCHQRKCHRRQMPTS